MHITRERTKPYRNSSKRITPADFSHISHSIIMHLEATMETNMNISGAEKREEPFTVSSPI